MPRKLLYLLVYILCVSSCSFSYLTYEDDGTAIFFKEAQKPFYHGVASGDPLSDRVIIWSRVTPTYQKPVEVEWMISESFNMTNPIKKGIIQTDSTRDYTIKIDVTGLSPNTTYYYQFAALKGLSTIGRTKTTATSQTNGVKLAIVSCSNYEAGYYNGFARIAERDDLDAVVHLGDYIYEYGPGTYGDESLGAARQHLPRNEILTLADYRTRYAQYRLDSDFQKVHQMHPFIVIWDDHEFTNNVYQAGAQNHQAEEGSFEKRKSIAKQVYFEWLPIREQSNQSIYRTIQFGGLVDLIMLDERVEGRTSPVDSAQQANYQAANRSMLGATQLAWFKEQLTKSTATWKIIGNQVIFSPLDISWRNPNSPFNLDAWDGYPYEQAQINQFLASSGVSNVIFTTGDTHCSWAFEVPSALAAYKEDPSKTVAIELGTPSITSANFNDGDTTDEEVMQAEAIFKQKQFNPHLKYTNLRDHGYLLLSLNIREAIAEWYYVDKINSRSSKERKGMQYLINSGNHQLIQN